MYIRAKHEMTTTCTKFHPSGLSGSCFMAGEWKTPPPRVSSRAKSPGLVKWKVHSKNVLFSDVRSYKIGKNAADRFSISPLVLEIFAFNVEKLVIWRQPS